MNHGCGYAISRVIQGDRKTLLALVPDGCRTHRAHCKVKVHPLTHRDIFLDVVV